MCVPCRGASAKASGRNWRHNQPLLRPRRVRHVHEALRGRRLCVRRLDAEHRPVGREVPRRVVPLYKAEHPDDTSNIVIGQQVGQIARFLLEIATGDYVITPQPTRSGWTYAQVGAGPVLSLRIRFRRLPVPSQPPRGVGAAALEARGFLGAIPEHDPRPIGRAGSSSINSVLVEYYRNYGTKPAWHHALKRSKHSFVAPGPSARAIWSQPARRARSFHEWSRPVTSSASPEGSTRHPVIRARSKAR